MGEARPPDAQARRVSGVLLALLLVLVTYLVVGEHPWNGGVAERLAEGRPARPVDYWVTYGWWAAVLCAVVVAGLLCTVSRWLPGNPPTQPRAGPAPRPAPRRVVLAVVAAVATAGALAAPRLGQSLWKDEDKTARSFVAGTYLPDSAGDLRFHEADWHEALLYSGRRPDNFVGYSVLARLGHQAFEVLAEPRDRRANEAILRLPALVAGLLAIAVVAQLVAYLGLSGSAAVAAWLLALHPWFLRYLTEARGYSLVLLLVTLGPLLLLRALHRSTWLRWCAYGACQLVLLWTYPFGVYPVAVLNALGVLAIARLYGRRPEGRAVWIRFGLANLAGASVWLLLMAGNIALMAHYLEAKPPRGLGGRFLRELLSLLATGTPWSHGPEGSDPVYPQLADLTHTAPLAVGAFLAVSLGFLAVGLVRLWRSHPGGPLLALAFVVPGPLGWAVSAARHDSIYTRQLIYALPGVAALVAIGLCGTARLAPAGRLRAATKTALAVGFTIGLLFVGGPARHALLTRSLQPYRESVAATRPNPDLFAPEQAQVLTASFSGEPLYYDPRVHLIDEVHELQALIAQADAQGLRLYVNLGQLEIARRRRPALLALVTESGLFQEVVVLHGFEPKYTRWVYLYRGGRAGSPGVSRLRSNSFGER